MASSNITVDGRDIGAHINVTITHVREMQIRLWIALRLIKLGCLIGRFGIEIKTSEE